MILVDTDVLSALAKVGRLPLPLDLFAPGPLHITPGILAELRHSYDAGREYAVDVFHCVKRGRIAVVPLTADESAHGSTLPATLGAGEREAAAVAAQRGGTVLSNESRVAHVCRQMGIDCLRLPDILRAFWMAGVASREDVRAAIGDLREKDRMEFAAGVAETILAEP